MDYREVLDRARSNMGPLCRSCPVCDGRACGNAIPGPGAKGTGTVAIRNYQAWQEVLVNMDTLHDAETVDTSFSLFGRTFRIPVFAGPVGAVTLHYGDRYDDASYDEVLVPACADAGIAAFVGDGTDPAVFRAGTDAIARAGGVGVPTVKPWDMDTIAQKVELANDCGAFAIAMDVDAAGLPFLQGLQPPAGPKSAEQLGDIVRMCEVPFIVKGVMTPEGARKALDAGAAGIVVSNHGGRVLDGVPATAEVLPQIVEAAGGRMRVFVDGGIRSGLDVFRALALGADAVLIARPFVNAVYGAQADGVQVLVDKLASELTDTMRMCGAATLADISREMLWREG
jgi:4-hydroxymandelate oxidase